MKLCTLITLLTVASATAFLPSQHGQERASASTQQFTSVAFPLNKPSQKSPVSPPRTRLQSSSSASSTEKDLDVDALVKYGAAIATQVSLFQLLFAGLDQVVAQTSLDIGSIPFAAQFIPFYVMALKSRALNPLLNSRPQPKTLETDSSTPKRNMPSWTPLGVVFPIMWLLIIAPIRATSSVLVYQATGTLTSLLPLVLHLSIGDTWNTVNNVEKRYGAAVVGVACVWLSKAAAAYQFYQSDAFAGKLLSATLIWLTIAGALVTATWQLNPTDGDEVDPLYPVKGDIKTEFQWFQKTEP